MNVTAELRRYVEEPVRSGRYQNENEVVRDAVRQMQQRGAGGKRREWQQRMASEAVRGGKRR